MSPISYNPARTGGTRRHIHQESLFPNAPVTVFSKRDIMPTPYSGDNFIPPFDRRTAITLAIIYFLGLVSSSVFPNPPSQYDDTSDIDHGVEGFKISSRYETHETLIHTLQDLARLNPSLAAASLSKIFEMLLPEQPEPNPISYHPAVNKVITQLGFRSVIALQVTYSNMIPGERLATRQRFASLLKTAADEGSITSEDLCQLTNSDGTLYPIKDQIRLFLAEIFGVQIKVESELLTATVIQNANGMLTLTVTDPESNKVIKTFTIRDNRLYDADGTVACKGDNFVISLPDEVLDALADGQEIDINRLVTEGNIFGLSSKLNNDTLGTNAQQNFSEVSIASFDGGSIILLNQGTAVSKDQLIGLLHKIADYYKIEYTEETSVIELLNKIQQKLVEARAIPEEQQH